MNGVPPDLFDKKYKKVCLLGEGAYGSVYLFKIKGDHPKNLLERVFQADRHFTSDYVAIKLYKRPSNRSEGIDFSCLREITCLQMFSHSNLMNCIEVMYNHTKESHSPY